MRQLTGSELAMVLLCGDFSDGLKPMTLSRFMALEEKVMASDMAMTQRDIKSSDLTSLGCADDEAEQIIALLDREEDVLRKLEELSWLGIQPITRISPEYPAKLRQKLKKNAPAVLFACGDIDLLQSKMVALVGPRDAGEEALDFSHKVGIAASKLDKVLISGGARGCDAAAEASALSHSGKVISVLADSLYRAAAEREEELTSGNLLLLTETCPYAAFSSARANSRNRLIHALPDCVFVAGAKLNKGGSWSGTYYNLCHSLSPVFILDDGSEAASSLVALGAVPVDSDLKGKDFDQQMILF